MGTLYGRLHLARLFLLVGVGLGLDTMLFGAERSRLAVERRPVLRRVWPGPVLFLGVVYTVSASGHAGVARPGWLAMSSDMAHLTAMSAWLGGLVILAVALLPGADRAELRTVLPTFSRVAFGCVVVIAATGTYQAWRESGSVVALLITGYGQLVLLKVALFIGLLIAGSVSRSAVQRRFVTPVPVVAGAGAPAVDRAAALEGPAPVGFDALAFAPGDLLELGADETSEGVSGLRRSVVFELLLAAVVLTVSGILVALPPARTAAAIPPAPPTFISASADAPLDAGRTATVSVVPSGHPGSYIVTVAVHGGAVPQQVTATASLPAQQLGPLPIPLRPSVPLAYQAYDILLPGTGLWTFTITVRTTEFDAVTTTARINIF
jgi:copper transport protein